MAWELIGPSSSWGKNVYLYKIVNQNHIPIAFLNYYVDFTTQIYVISNFEVVSYKRSQGIGEKIIQTFFRREGILPEKVILEPLTMEAARFWRKCGVPCYHPEEDII